MILFATIVAATFSWHATDANRRHVARLELHTINRAAWLGPRRRAGKLVSELLQSDVQSQDGLRWQDDVVEALNDINWLRLAWINEDTVRIIEVRQRLLDNFDAVTLLNEHTDILDVPMVNRCGERSTISDVLDPP